MASGYETNTLAPPETELETRLLSWTNDYTILADSKHPYWYETSVFDNGDGTRTVYSNRVPKNEPPQEPGDLEGVVLQGRGDDYRTFEILTGLTKLSDNKVIGKALEVLGISAHEESYSDESGKSYAATYPNPNELNVRLDYIRKVTGYAPAVQIDPKPNYTNHEQAEALGQRIILVAGNPDDEPHDIVNHAAAQFMLAESTLQRIARRSQQVVARTDELRHLTEEHTEHFRWLEYVGSYRLLLAIARCTEDAPEEDSFDELTGLLATVMFKGSESQKPENKAIAEDEARATIARVKELASLEFSV